MPRKTAVCAVVWAIAFLIIAEAEARSQQVANIKRLVEYLDLDGDGRVSEAEFKGTAEEFRILDADVDGWFTDYDLSTIRSFERRELLVPFVAPAAILFSVLMSALLVWRQLRVNAFLDFTDRYSTVHSDLPTAVVPKSPELDELTGAEQKALWKYFFLYWIEWKVRPWLLDGRTWRVWQKDLAGFLHNNPQAWPYWQTVKNRYEQPFQDFIRRLHDHD